MRPIILFILHFVLLAATELKPKDRTKSRLTKDLLNSLKRSEGEVNLESSLQSPEQDYSDQKPYVYSGPCSPLSFLKPVANIGFIVPAFVVYLQYKLLFYLNQ